jgi:hypothetical protein
MTPNGHPYAVRSALTHDGNSGEADIRRRKILHAT